ncbi:MAG: NUDIX hydrolase [Bacteroidales bacterium]|nr:NUDIX hydrolase [Bacteroidales bacterium]
MGKKWLDIARQLQSIAQAGLTFSDNKYDIDRYQQLRDISLRMINEITDIKTEKLTRIFTGEKGYQTPKVDIRGVVFRGEKILMVKETVDGLWSVPGGWADIGLTPFQVVTKEVREEAGLIVEPVRLLALLDKRSHAHPPDLFHIYKIFILCHEKGGKMKPGMETSHVAFYGINELPPLSTTRITEEQIKMLFDFRNHPEKSAICD